MATTWVNFNNGDTGLAVRTALNNYNTGTNSDMVSAEGRLTANESAIATNTGNVATNTADIVTNTADIATNTSDIVDLQTPASVILEDVTGVEPAYIEGQSFYAEGMWHLQGKYDDVTLQVGRESHIDVHNASGVTIPNGTPIRHSGTSAGKLLVVPATADSFVNAVVIGVTTHEILDGSDGLATTFGLVGMDTSLLPAGTPLYLGEAGGLVATPPDLATQVGGITDSAVDGRLFVWIESNTALPTIYGNMNGGSVPATLTQSTFYTIDGYSVEDDVYMPTNTAGGLISVPTNGRYKLSITGEFRYGIIGNAEEEVTILFESNDSVDQHSITVSLPRNSALTTLTITTSRPLLADKDYRVRISPLDSTLTGVTLTAEFDLTSVRLDV